MDLDLSTINALVLITGAGKGFGQALALSAAEILGNGTFILCGRNLETLHETETLIKSINEKYETHSFAFDQSKFSEIQLEKELSALIVDNKFDAFMIFHNAGSLGDLSQWLTDLQETSAVSEYFQLNLIGMIIVNNIFLKHVKKLTSPQIFIINISSLAAIKEFPSWGLYCIGKTARESYIRSLSVDLAGQNQLESVFLLSYAPGPLKTDMMRYLLDSTQDTNLRDTMKNVADTGNLLEPIVSARRLFRDIIQKYKHFANGGRIDYFDLE